MAKFPFTRLAMAIAAVALATGIAFAAVTFKSVSVTLDNATADLDIAFTAVGLPSGTDTIINATAPYSSVWACVSRSSKLVKPTISDPYYDLGQDNASVHLTVDKNGRAIGTVTLSPEERTGTCQGNKTWEMVKVEYGTVTLTVNGATWTGSGATWNPYGL